MATHDADRRPRAGEDPRLRDRDAQERTRVRRHPRTGTKITTIVAAALLVTAAYYLFAPVYMDTANGWFGCGSAARGSDSEFVQNVCKGAPSLNLARALLAAGLAVVVGGLGASFFGFDTTTETRRVPVRSADDDDLDLDDGLDLDDREARRSRRGDRRDERRDDERWDDEQHLDDEDDRSPRDGRHVRDRGRRRDERDERDDWDL